MISEKVFNYVIQGRASLSETSKKVFTYGSVEPLQIKGVCSLTVSEPQTGKSIVADFFVTPGKATTLLGRKASEFLGVLRVGVSINTCDVKPDRKAALREKFPNVFKGLDKLKDYKLKLHIYETVTPVAQPLRRIPSADGEGSQKN